ncbi:MAG: SIS domain-containing protein [Solobacterium sp.]|jgi:uncharacterized phosphosugar-binding protein|nr:SIS domain-containing protein [Solobacterium sp.]MCH4206101.1 SIS domain-containing protein [Solobacterium sp.]MCH4227567.1 SIS domain-containing protein [Solobacterium sp.]MCH4282991.1 SIS domain-containing protein [Solobacterium sp.]
MAYEFAYMNAVDSLLHKAAETNQEQIRKLSEKMAENVMQDKIIHTFGTGHSHMIGIELFGRAGGLGNVDAILDPDVLTSNGAQRSCALEKLSGLADLIYDNYHIEKGDMMIISSNSGRNAMPIEMAMRCQKEGVYVVAVTSLQASKAAPSRHASGKHLYECADLVLDNCVPAGDSLVTYGGIKTGAGSTIASVFMLDTAVAETIRILTEKGVRPPVLQSQNVDGFDNDAIYSHYGSRVRHY